ncbi:sugar ABC transporter substrate-binding protein [Desulfofundulus sp. TPOSR]|uniref:sugar ABC transporter substrate-binding protein n=1 Tax=Desulfofundulus sp. TPOSR TaxID=2714340 RepID=UPI00140DC551|nr:sugar ABC transporter substrate-binding protein [Desulfofundulus sp. TPOSR]NHM28335.1 sugar ABC transporter substrate-binding protein [Desulfofundulus sp. TPOSR]
MKRILWVVFALTLAACLILAGCGQKQGGQAPSGSSSSESTGEKKDKVKIGVAISDFDDKWLSYMLDAMREYAATLTDAEVIFVDSKSDVATQLGQLENFVAQKVDAIVVNPVDTDATEPYTRMAKEAGIPLISVNRLMKNQDEATAYVGSESIKSGIMEMEYLAKKMNYKGNVAILIGDPAHEAARMRTEGIKQVIKKYPNMKVVAEQAGYWQRSKGMEIMENWLQSGLKIDCVASNNDEKAIGAILALEEAGKLDKVLVGGIDATPDALEFLKAGKLAVTVFQNAEGQGKGAIEAAYKVAKGEKIEPYIYIPYELVPPEKYDEYMAKWKK